LTKKEFLSSSSQEEDVGLDIAKDVKREMFKKRR